MTTVFFLRHGPTQENRENRIQGQQPGTLLIQETEQYLAAVTPLLREKAPTVLLSSDLERAVKTRGMLKNFLQIPDIKEGTSPLLREKAMGFYEGLLWNEVPEAFRTQFSKERDYDFRQFGGENEEDVRARVSEALRRFAQQYPGMRICCVTHAGWIKVLVGLADKAGILSDGWSDRTAIYEGGIGPIGQLLYFHPIALEAQLPLDAN
jgi:broad specificity phosphatase PhoE